MVATTRKENAVVQAPRLQRSGVIEVDEALCLACRECEVSCSLYHEQECNPSLSRIRVEVDDELLLAQGLIDVYPAPPERPVIGFKKVGRKRIYHKCDLCVGRPEGPICVEICPGGALKFVAAEGRRK